MHCGRVFSFLNFGQIPLTGKTAEQKRRKQIYETCISGKTFHKLMRNFKVFLLQVFRFINSLPFQIRKDSTFVDQRLAEYYPGNKYVFEIRKHDVIITNYRNLGGRNRGWPLVMVLPFIEGRPYRNEKAGLHSNPHFLLPPISAENANSEKFVGNKSSFMKLKISNCSSSKQRESTLPLSLTTPGGKELRSTNKKRVQQFSDTDWELPPIIPGKLEPDQFLEVWNKLNKTEIRIPSCTSPLFLKEKFEKLNLPLSDQLAFPDKDAFTSQYIARPKSIEKTLSNQGIQRLRNGFSTVTASWHLRKDCATYKRQELSDLFSLYGPIKCIRFQSPRRAEIEFVWLTSACLAVRAARLFAPGKASIFRRWTHAPLQEQLWDKKKSWPK